MSYNSTKALDLFTNFNMVDANVYIYSSVMQGYWIVLLLALLMLTTYIYTDNIAPAGFIGMLSTSILLFGQGSSLNVDFGGSLLLLYFMLAFSFALVLYNFFGKKD